MKKSERYQHDKTATCKKFYFIGSVLGNRVLTEKTGYHSSDGSAFAFDFQHANFRHKKVSDVKRIRIFLKPHFFTQIGLYTSTKLVHIFPRKMIIASVLLNICGKFKPLKEVFKVIPS